jgi:hypothetical protein
MFNYMGSLDVSVCWTGTYRVLSPALIFRNIAGQKLQFTIFGKNHTLIGPTMTERSDILQIGDLAPAFSLAAANQPGTFSLAEVRGRGPVIVEFLRGTW